MRKISPLLNAITIFIIGLTISLGVRTAASEIAWSDLTVACWLLPAVGLGYFISRKLTGKVDGKRLRTVIPIVASAAAVGLLVRAFG